MRACPRLHINDFVRPNPCFLQLTGKAIWMLVSHVRYAYSDSMLGDFSRKPFSRDLLSVSRSVAVLYGIVDAGSA